MNRDDILLAAESIEEMFVLLAKILEIFKRHEFTLNLAKCKFFQTKIDYLGRKISFEGVKAGDNYETGENECIAMH